MERDAQEVKRTKPAQRRRRPAQDPKAGTRRERTASESRRRPAEGQAQHRKQPKRRPEGRRVPPKPLPRRKLILNLVTIGAVVLAVFLGITVFFKVQTFHVTGNSKYTSEEIIIASGIQKGENLLAFGESEAAGSILAQLPYVDQIQVGIKLPGTVNIDIVELEVSYGVQTADGTWWLMDAGGKMLEAISAEEAQKHTCVIGVHAASPVPGGEFLVEEPQSPEDPDAETAPTEPLILGTMAQRAEAVLEILRTLEAYDRTAQVTLVDVTELYDIQVWYGEKYQVLLAGPTELAYKIRYMTEAVASLEADGYRGGVLDLSFQEPGKASFSPW